MSKLIDDDSPTTRRLAEVAPRQQPMAYMYGVRAVLSSIAQLPTPN